jgi:hypothetical protein
MSKKRFGREWICNARSLFYIASSQRLAPLEPAQAALALIFDLLSFREAKRRPVPLGIESASDIEMFQHLICRRCHEGEQQKHPG